MKVYESQPLKGIEDKKKVFEKKKIEGKVEGERGVERGVKVEEKVDISGVGKMIVSAKKELEKVPEVRREKVEKIKEAIKRGTYKIDSEKVAENMLKESLLEIK